METDSVKHRSRQKRRERALQLQQEKQTRDEVEASGQDNDSPPRSSKDKFPRSKPKKGKGALFEEDVIDGFAILSFKTLEELEVVSKKNGCIKDKSRSEEDNSTKDVNTQVRDDIDKVKKKKPKKNSTIGRSLSNCVDISENGNENNASRTPSFHSRDDKCSSANNSEISGSSTGGSRPDKTSENQARSQDHHRHRNGPMEPLRSISRDGMSDASTRSGSGQGYVCDVESGDDKVSESGSDLYSGIPVVGLLNDLACKNHSNHCVTLTESTPPPSTSATPTSLCNGIGNSTKVLSPIPQLLVATTTTTTTTTTSTTSRLGSSDSLTTSTATAVSNIAVQSQSVIHPTQCYSEHPGSKPSQFSPGSFHSQGSSNKRTLSPNSLQTNQNHHNSFTGDSSTCARSLQYSKSHRPSHSSPKGGTSQHSPASLAGSNDPHLHQNHPQKSSSENLKYIFPGDSFSQLGHQSSNLTESSSHFPFHSPPTGSGYSLPYPAYPSHIHPEPLGNHHVSLYTSSESKVDQQCNSGSSQSLASNTGHTGTSTTSPLISNSLNPYHQHQDRSNSSSNHHHRSSSSRKSNTQHQHHSHHHSSNGPASPSGNHSKRHCRSPSSGLPPPTTPSLSTANVFSLKDTPAKFTPPLPPKPQNCKQDHLNLSSVGSSRDHLDIKPKESSVGHSHHTSITHPHQHSKHQRDRDRELDKQRTPVSSISLPPTLFPHPKPTWSSTPGPLYNPLLQLHQPSPLTPSPALHSLGPHPPSSSVTPHTSPLFTLPLTTHPSPLLAAGTSALSTGMFAPPLHPTAPSLSSAPPLPPHPATENLIRSQDFLHQDLNNRLLAHRDSSAIALSPSPFVRSETHQHQHQHLHNHMHQHTYGGLSAAALVPPAPPLFDKIPKAFDAGVFRPSIVPNYSAAISSLLPPGPSGASLASNLQGAFQPKNLVPPGQMLVAFRDREAAVTQPGLPPPQKKQGKWCAVHVRVAWEIFNRQQKKLQRDQDGATSSSSSKPGQDVKPLEPLLRPPSHLLPGGSVTVRPPESSLLASVARSLPDGLVHPSSSFLTSAAHLGMSPFPRPSPYPLPSLLNPLGFSGLGGSMFSSVRDMVPTGLPSSLSSSPHEWNRLHRIPSSFPSWPKSEAEKERERELRKEEDRERERRGSLNHLSGLDDPRHKDAESSRPKSRSRSRSPLRNGRVDHHGKPDMGSYDRRYDEKRPQSTSSSSAGLKLKEERREDMSSLSHHVAEREKMERERIERERIEKDRFERDRMERDRLERERLEKEKLLQSAAAAEREKLIQAVEQRDKFFQTSGYLGLSPFSTGLPTHPGLLDRRMGLMGPPGTSYPFLERPPVPTSMWSPFDKSTVEIAHRLEIERERERMAMMSRLSSIPSHLAVLEQERLKEQILREQQEREYELRRQYLDRLPAFTADRLRAADPLAPLGAYFPRTVSPMFGPAGVAGLKSNSPHGIPGVPPPLISSSSTAAASMLSSRSHNNSPSSSSKSKGCSPADSTSDLKDKREGSSTDPDAHSR